MAKTSERGDTWRTIAYAVLIALVIRTFGFEPFSIPSGSMIPTLLVGDYLFVSKYTYGFSRYSFPRCVPFTDLCAELFEGRVLSRPVERGDVVVFKLPRDDRVDYIKRIVGLPNDRIQVKNGILHINGEPVKREPAEGSAPLGASLYWETLPNGRRHLILEASDTALYDNTDVYVVPPGHYFAMGDNRDSSLDSRVEGEVGFVPERNLVGRAEIIFFSTDGTARIWQFWLWPQATRFKRLFQTIE